MSEHAKLSPSGAHIWARCPANGAIPPLPEEEGETPSYLLDGTAAHHMLEHILNEDNVIDDFDAAPDDMRAAVLRAVDTVNIIIDSCKLPIWTTEERLVMPLVSSDMFGTADIIIRDRDQDLWVIDYKHGQGVAVEAEHNYQLALYALGALNKYGSFERLHMHIIQPRVRTGHWYKTWDLEEYDVEDFRTNYEIMFRKAVKTIEGWDQLSYDDRYNPGSHCRFCKVKPVCPVLADTIARMLVSGQEDPAKMDLDHLADMYQFKPHILNLLKTVDMIALQRAKGGKTVPGHKLVNSITRRQWVDVDAVCEQLDKSYEPGQYLKRGLKGFKIIEDLVGVGFVEHHTSRPEPVPVLALNSDKRQAIEISVKDDFEDLGKEQKDV